MARRVLTNSVVVLELGWVNADALLIGVVGQVPTCRVNRHVGALIHP